MSQFDVFNFSIVFPVCSLGSSLIIFSSFLFFRFLVKNVKIDRNK